MTEQTWQQIQSRMQHYGEKFADYVIEENHISPDIIDGNKEFNLDAFFYEIKPFLVEKVKKECPDNHQHSSIYQKPNESQIYQVSVQLLEL